MYEVIQFLMPIIGYDFSNWKICFQQASFPATECIEVKRHISNMNLETVDDSTLIELPKGTFSGQTVLIGVYIQYYV